MTDYLIMGLAIVTGILIERRTDITVIIERFLIKQFMLLKSKFRRKK